ncbi:hypothetical protein DCAR_0209588 [Daucus carota subsp. sativus]|uniref:Uncharacterized protein n=1 Tax=Daucus carota subsp. sativus TaxID=79200 RepID=A0A166FDJ0_DAUCS|nr:PREDICTED: peroxisome biogenesis protein 19-1-like [Daucus carota subsp. sativus]WOG90345.1 hypothetical protein DCAR_0209588 [Daucus carota subsp. sativus]
MTDQSDELDQLLDSALDDFQNLNFASAAQRSGDKGGNKEKNGSVVSGSGVKGLGMGLPDLKAKKMGKQKVSKESHHVSEALDKLREQTRETVKGLETITAPVPDFGNDAMMQDFVKQFEELAGSQDMNSIMETMMQQLLSKDVLQDPMREIGGRYPKWLEDHKATLSTEEYERYSHQHELIKEINGVYETEPGNFNKIVELMQKMQECGQPPDDIMRELAPDFDISTIGQLSPEMLNSQQNCSVM